MLDPSPQQTPAERSSLVRAKRIKFDRWLFDYDIDNVTAARLLGVHPMSIGRFRKRFNDPGRRIPDSKFILDVYQLSAGEVRFEDWAQPCEVTYVTPEADPGPAL